GTSIQNRDYSLKTYNRYKKHSNCRCDFFDINQRCDKCDLTCKRKIAAWGRGTLPKEVVGLFEFREFREIEKSFTKACREKKNIKELKLEEHQGDLD
ncbi:19816_t:CDS:1, partial [Racocetra persica]